MKLLSLVLFLLVCMVRGGQTPDQLAYMDEKLWVGIESQAPTAPVVSQVQTDHGKAVRFTAVTDGKYQRFNLNLPSKVDLRQVSALTFDLRQKIRPGKEMDLFVRFRYSGKSGLEGVVRLGRQEWVHVILPIDLRTMSGGKQNSAALGVAEAVEFSFFSAFDHSGQCVDITNVCFLPKVSDTAVLPVVRYHYRNAPDSGDSSGTVLTDGAVAEANQAYYRVYSHEPDIEFDLGAYYLVSEVRLSAVAVPCQGISDYTLYASRDGKDWTTAAHVTNANSSADKQAYAIAGRNLKALGRYFRIHASRSRVDFPLHIAEVTFAGKLPTDEEIADAVQHQYDMGPALPDVSEANCWKLTEGDATVWVDRATGIVSRYQRGSRRLAERIFGRYELSDGKKKTLADDYAAQVTGGSLKDGVLTVDFTLKALAGISFRRVFSFADGDLSTTLYLDSRREDKQVLFTASEVVLPQELRRGGLYESWGAGHTVQHKFAAEIPFQYPADTGPVTVFEQPRLPLTLLHFRYAYDGRYVQIGSGVITVAGFGDKRTIFTPTGWVIGDGLFELTRKGVRHSVESRLSDTEGDLTAAFDRYLALPEVKQFRGRIRRPAWLKEMRFYASQEWDGYWGNTNLRQAAFYESTIREGRFILANCDIDFFWGDYPTSGKVRNVFNGIMTAEECRNRAIELHRLAPKLKFTEYTWLWSAGDKSQVFKNHPEWFITHNAEGQEINFFPGWHLNYYRMVGNPASRQEMVEAITRFVEYYRQDVWYLDGGGSPSSINWPTLQVDEPDAWDKAYLAIRESIQKSDPERAVFFNNPENPIADLGFLESFGGVLTTDWRDGATWMYRFKLWQRRDPLYCPMYIYWIAGVDRALRHYVVGTGLMPALHTGDPDERRDVVYVSAQQQSRPARLVNARLTPNWRYDARTFLEAMPLTFGESGWIFINSHGTTPQTETFAFDAAPMGLTCTERPLYQWRFDLIDHTDYRGLLTEPEQEKNYRGSRWQSDFILQPSFLGKTPYARRVERKLTVNPDRMAIWYVTQSPALVYSVDGLRNQILLSETLGVKVTGELQENTLALDVDSSRTVAEIIAVLPEGKGVASAMVNGKAAEWQYLFFGKARVVLLPVAKGNSRVAIQLKEVRPLAAAGISLQSSTPAPGRRLSVTAKGLPQDAEATLALYAGADLVWSAPMRQNLAETTVPTGATGGIYELRLMDAAGTILASQPLTLPAGTPGVPRLLVAEKVPTTCTEKRISFDLPERGVTGLRQAVQLEEANCRAVLSEVEPKITLETLPRYATHWHCSAAAQELKVRRYLKIRLDATFGWYHREGPTPGLKGLSPRFDKPNAFCGLTFDFGTSAGYTVRTLGGIGIALKNRTARDPYSWGTKQAPQHIFSISNLAISTRDGETFWIDCRELGAPDAWDGRLWLGVMMQYVSPSHRITMTLLESRDQLPPGEQPAQVFPLRGGRNKAELTRLALPVLKEAPPQLDASLDEPCWKNALVIDRFYRVNDPLEQPPATVMRLWSDQAYLYFGIELTETRPAGFVIDKNNKPWFVDGFEFYFRSDKTKPSFVQYIVNGTGTWFAERFTDEKPGSPRTKLARPRYSTAVKNNVMTIEGTIPLDDLGPAPWRFLGVRNRMIDGTSFEYTHFSSDKKRNFEGVELTRQGMTWE